MSKLDELRANLRELRSVVVALSGGVDSTLLAYVANQTLGSQKALAITAVSPSLAPEEEEVCRDFAARWNLNWHVVHTDEMADPEYVMNDGTRCAHCKTALMDGLEPIAKQRGATVVLGVNLDDLADHRPGQKAAAERGAVFPFVSAAMTKADIRSIARDLGLETWDKPAAACLSSRIPYGTPVTLKTLSSVANAESALRALGFNSLRVRHYDETARIEVPVEDLAARRRTEGPGCRKRSRRRLSTCHARLGGPEERQPQRGTGQMSSVI